MDLAPDPFDIAAALVRALVLYSLAEVQAGHASVIHVDVSDLTFSVSDDGRGHSIDRSVGGAPYLKLVYEHLEYPFARWPAVMTVVMGIFGVFIAAVRWRQFRQVARSQGA